MKVKELIENLRKLDQDKEIFVLYDYYYPIEPVVKTANAEDDEFSHIGIGNYFIEAD